MRFKKMFKNFLWTISLYWNDNVLKKYTLIILNADEYSYLKKKKKFKKWETN